MALKKIIGFVLLGLAVITFFLYLSFPFLLSGSKKVILFTVSVYILNKIFLYSSIYILGKQFISRIGKYLPKWIEKPLLKILRVQPMIDQKKQTL